MAASQLALAYLDVRARDDELKKDLAGMKGAVLGLLGMIAGGAKGIMSGMVGAIRGTFSKIGSMIKGVFTGILNGLHRVFEVAAGMLLASSITTSFEELKSLFVEMEDLARIQDQAEKKVAAAFRATSNAAGITVDEIKAVAKQMQEVTNYGDEVILNAAGILATFTQIKDEQFTEALWKGMDLASAFGQDLKQTMIQLGKALNDPAKGYIALKKTGVSFTEEQIEQIKNFTAMGDLIAAQQVILDELEAEAGGMAQAMADPVIQARNAIGDLKEQFGKIIMQFKEAAAIRFLGWLKTDQAKAFIDTLKMGLTWVLETIGRIADGVHKVFGWFKAGLDTEQGRQFVAVLKESWELLKEIGTNLYETFAGIFQQIATWTEAALGGWTGWFQTISEYFRNMLDWVSLLSTNWTAAWETMKAAVAVAGSMAKDTWHNVWNLFKASAASAWASVSTLMEVAIDKIAGCFEDLAILVMPYIKAIGAAFKETFDLRKQIFGTVDIEKAFEESLKKEQKTMALVKELRDMTLDALPADKRLDRQLTPAQIAAKVAVAGAAAFDKVRDKDLAGDSAETRSLKAGLKSQVDEMLKLRRQQREERRKPEEPTKSAEKALDKDRNKPLPGEAVAAEAAAKTTGKTAMVGFAELSAKMQQSLDKTKEVNVQKEIVKEVKDVRKEIARGAREGRRVQAEVVTVIKGVDRTLKKKLVAKAG